MRRQTAERVTVIVMALVLATTLIAIAASYQSIPMVECAWCHHATNLNRHHVVPQAAAPELRDVATNIVVLCRDCHFVIGHRCNWKRYNPDVLEIVAKYTNCLVNARLDKE